MITDLHSLRAVADPADPAATLAAFRQLLPGDIVFTTSFGVEDQVITHMIASQDLDIAIVTLDTGRLFPEVYDVWTATEARYGLRIKAAYPEARDLEALVASQGIDGFRNSTAARKACCTARKVVPLGRLLTGADGWVTGLRASQSATRGGLALVSAEVAYSVVKLNPLMAWSREDAVAYTSANDVPVNALHGKGFLSIGCAPCTRAIQPGEPERAGRWWWEQDSVSDPALQECGLHEGVDGWLIRNEARALA